MEYDQAMSGKVSQNMLHGVECDPAQNSGTNGKYVRSGPPKEGDDLKQYDWANLNMAVCNIPSQFANQALGEIWVSYTVELRKPKFYVSRGLNILRDTFVGGTGVPDTLDKLVAKNDFAYGQQNRIGGTLSAIGVPANPLKEGGIRYTFPATFSGSVCIKITTCNYTESSGQVTNAHEFSNANISINAIMDIWKNATVGFDANLVTRGEMPGEFSTQELHLNIITPTSAGTSVDNYIDFVSETYQGIVGLLQPAPVTAFTIDISMYNTSFNYPSSGNIMLVNPVTEVQEQWP